MTAPAAPPRLTDAQIGTIEREAATGLAPSARNLRSLVAEVRASRAAAERAEGLASAATALVHRLSARALERSVMDCAPEEWRVLRAALASYRGSAGGGTTS